jgi:signal peptidase II
MANKCIENKKDGGVYSLKGSILWGILLFFVLIFVDQLTKILADAYFSQEDAPAKIVFIPGWINFCITYNRGISYGMGTNAPEWLKIGVIAATGVLMTVFAVFYFILDKRRSLLRLALVFVVAGGVGNLIDRVYYQVWDVNTLYGVRDMVDLSRLGFAVCNFADFFICGGAVMLVLALLFFDKDAMYPMTAKYKALAKEAEADEEKKTEEKRRKKQEKVTANSEKKDE